MNPHPLTEGMNPQQAAAISAGTGPILVLAGPGSGKTAVLTRRIAWLIREEQVPHYRIIAVTFTNKAAGEMRSRVEDLLGGRLRGLQIGTFHSICARFLRREAEELGYRSNFLIYDTDDSVALIKRVMKVLNIDAKTIKPKKMLNRISRAKTELILPQDYQTHDYFDEIVRQIYVGYQQALIESNAMDFDDLLLNMVLALRRSPAILADYQQRFTHILVDEFQDTNHVQNELVKLLAAPQNNLFAVGDEDQSIYAFRGADYRNILGYRQQYPGAKQFLLEQNYRSTQRILTFAGAIIDQNPQRTPKALHTDLGDGERVRLQESYNIDYQAEYVLEQIQKLVMREGLQYKDCAVLYRSNWLSRAVEQHLMRENVPYVIIGGIGFYERREVKDMLAYLRLAYNPNDRVSFERVINTPSRGIGSKSVADFNAWVEQSGMTLEEALARVIEFAPTAMKSAARKRIREFAILFSGWRQKAARDEMVTLLNDIFSQTNYDSHLNKISGSKEEYNERRENVQEIWRMLERAEDLQQSLESFILEQSLYASVDDLTDGDNRVALITLHSAKGLEFPAVFIVSIDKGVLPHPMALAEHGGLEEERRLFYVGITRAERHLFLSYTFNNGPSEFLFDLPAHLLSAPRTVLSTLRSAQSIDDQTRWQSPTSRLQSDLRNKTVSPPDSKIRSKIVPFSSRPSSDSPFKVGASVSHPVFGRGKVIGLEKNGTIVSVIFDEHGPKKILADPQGLKLIDA